jgi:hypothetical protein
VILQRQMLVEEVAPIASGFTSARMVRMIDPRGNGWGLLGDRHAVERVERLQPNGAPAA